MDEYMVDEGNKLCVSASTQNTWWNVNDLIKNKSREIYWGVMYTV